MTETTEAKFSLKDAAAKLGIDLRSLNAYDQASLRTAIKADSSLSDQIAKLEAKRAQARGVIARLKDATAR